MKQCKKCGQEKPETSFPMRSGKDYREHTYSLFNGSLVGTAQVGYRTTAIYQ